MDIKAGATVDVSPKGGQIAVFSLLAFAACSFGASVWLYAEQKPFALPLIGAVVFLAIGSIFWTMSHRNEALKHSHPFTMNLGEGENALAISADARSMPALNYIKEMLDHYSSIFHRAPLPQASGVIGPDGQPILGTEAEAQLITDQANLVAQQQCDALLGRVIFHEGVAATDGSPVVDQLTP